MSASTVLVLCLLLYVERVTSYEYDNLTRLTPANRQLLDFKLNHPIPVGLLTHSYGEPVDIRDVLAINSDATNNNYLLDNHLHVIRERIPERVVHAKGAGAHGYFVVTNDVSKYTSADVFNKVGKKTPIFCRFSTGIANLGGNDLERVNKGFAVKFYTKEGNLDLLGLNMPVYLYREPQDFTQFTHAFKRNPRSNLFDNNARWDLVTKRPGFFHGILWLLSDYGIPLDYTRMNGFPIHTYEIYNKLGEKYYIKFNFRTEQGLANLTDAEAAGLKDPDYYVRQLYNTIENKIYPSWKVEMDVMDSHDIKNLDYNPFEINRLWKKGTFHTVTIGRMVFNKNPDNAFRDVELIALNPANLVPGISGPVDYLIKTRRLTYRDAQNYRLGSNTDRIRINLPDYEMTYNRDGKPPARENTWDVPNYYPNSFNGPVPFVDESKPNVRLVELETTAEDLQKPADFLHEYVRTEAERERLATNAAATLVDVYPDLQKRVIRLFFLLDPDLGELVEEALEIALAKQAARVIPPPPAKRRQPSPSRRIYH